MNKFPRRRSPPILHTTPSSVHLRQSQKYEPDPVFLQQQASVQVMGIVNDKEVVKDEVWVRPPIAKKTSMSGLPLHLFGSMRSKSSSKRTKSTKSSTSRFSGFSIAPTIPDMPSFIWRETTDETDEGSTKDSECDDDKHSGRGDRVIGRHSTWLEQDSDIGDPGARPSLTFEEEENWLEQQLGLEQFSPIENEQERRFSQGTGLHSSISSIPSFCLAPSSARAQNLRRHQRYESASSAFSSVPEIPAAPMSPLFPEGHEWYQTLNLGESRPGSYGSEAESARIPIGLQIPSALSPPAAKIPIELQIPSALPPPVTPHMTSRGTPHITPRGTPRQSQSYNWHQRQGSENSIMQARIESIPQNPASHYQGRTSEDSIRWPSTPQSASQEEALRINQERFPPRMSSRIFPPRGSSCVPLPQENGVRFQPYFAAPNLEPSISPRRFWQQKPLPPPPPVARKPLPKGILKKPSSPPETPLPPAPPMPFEPYRVGKKGKEKRDRTSGLPLGMFFGSSSHTSSSSKSSL